MSYFGVWHDITELLWAATAFLRRMAPIGYVMKGTWWFSVYLMYSQMTSTYTNIGFPVIIIKATTTKFGWVFPGMREWPSLAWITAYQWMENPRKAVLPLTAALPRMTPCTVHSIHIKSTFCHHSCSFSVPDYCSTNISNLSVLSTLLYLHRSA